LRRLHYEGFLKAPSDHGSGLDLFGRRPPRRGLACAPRTTLRGSIIPLAKVCALAQLFFAHAANSAGAISSPFSVISKSCGAISDRAQSGLHLGEPDRILLAAGLPRIRSVRLDFLGGWPFCCEFSGFPVLDFLGFPWILSSESRLINGLRGFFSGKKFSRRFSPRKPQRG
jgi:hypothetical protein